MSLGTGSDALADLFAEVVAGRYPEPDGGFRVVPPDATTGHHAVLCFTGHAVVATDWLHHDVRDLGADGVGGAHHPDVLRALAGPDAFIDVLDATLLASGRGVGGTALTWTDRHDDHPRVRYARRGRVDVRVLADDRLGDLGAHRREGGAQAVVLRRACRLGRRARRRRRL